MYCRSPQRLPFNTAPTTDLVVTSSPSPPGGSVTLQLDARGIATGAAAVTTEMTTRLVDGTTVVTSPVTVSR